MKSLLIVLATLALSLAVQAAGVLWPYKAQAAQSSATLKISCDADRNITIKTEPGQ